MPAGFTPVYKIMKDGNDITDRFNDRATEIQVILKGGNGDSDTCAITIDDRDWKVAPVEIDAKIEVYLGYKEIGYAQQGVFKVTTVDYEINPQQIRIVGSSTEFTGALKAPQIKDYEGKTLGDIIKSIAGNRGAGSYISPELASEKIPFLNQITSPLHLLHELERRFNALAKFENDRLVFVKRDEGETAGGISMPVLVLRPENLARGFVRHTQRGDYSGVKVGWFDDNHRKHYVEEKNGSYTPEEGAEAGEGNPFLHPKLGRSESEAKAMARSQLAALRRSMGEAHLTLSKGNPWIRDQMRILLQRFRDKIDGSYVTDTVTHTFTKGEGIGTEILAKPPGTGADYASLDDGEFYGLGAGFVGEGGRMSKPDIDGINRQADENAGAAEPERPEPDVPVNT